MVEKASKRGVLAGRVAIITGGGRGIGRSIANTFAHEGASIVICARTESQLEQARHEIEQIGAECAAVIADVSKEGDVTRVVETTVEAFGRLDVLINNAGITHERPFLEFDLEDWDRLWRVNVMSVVLFLRAVLPTMLEANYGRIVNVASGAALRGLPGNAAYSASKAGVVALTHSVADEVKDTGICINAICPGPIESEMLNSSKVRGAVTSNQVILPPEDVARTALFLASEAAKGVNSQIVVVRRANRW